MTYSIYELEHDMCREIRESAGFISLGESPRQTRLRGVVRAVLGVTVFAMLIPLFF